MSSILNYLDQTYLSTSLASFRSFSLRYYFLKLARRLIKGLWYHFDRSLTSKCSKIATKLTIYSSCNPKEPRKIDTIAY